MTGQQVQRRNRYVYLDVLRIIAAFLVIVNHTNSRLFRGSDPTQTVWYLSVAWYYVSKTAVSMFVMISGALLLNRQDSYKRAFVRVARMVGALFVFSYVYFLYDAWVNYDFWSRAIRLDAFISNTLAGKSTLSFWYLYFYIGLLIALPLLQRLAANATKRDIRYLIIVAFGVNAVWRLVSHYVSGLKLSPDFDVPLASSLVGAFFAGHYIHNYCSQPKRNVRPFCWIALVLSVGISLLLTTIEYGRVELGEKYWFMDDAKNPSIFTIINAIVLMVLLRSYNPYLENCRASRMLCMVGSCTFGIYLLQDLIILKSIKYVFQPLCGIMPSFLAVILWEIAVFAIGFAITWALKKIPGIKKLI